MARVTFQATGYMNFLSITPKQIISLKNYTQSIFSGIRTYDIPFHLTEAKKFVEEHMARVSFQATGGHVSFLSNTLKEIISLKKLCPDFFSGNRTCEFPFHHTEANNFIEEIMPRVSFQASGHMIFHSILLKQKNSLKNIWQEYLFRQRDM
ncbi:hypothetical protein TNIN_165941 [Trichonephila inaurata madagascariensis]|uniref:Uncharacterized protein n=1 Tax=Trichonephila inaurata madagascariensis TaxID=2747483 RepID=A0A8X7C5H5_9ARAC|nr:hypothetical protein TNIN_165941 [Trichonephila inaurata madagascariensis]